MNALFICDPGWSTGNVVKGLVAALPHWAIEMHDWVQPYTESAHDAVICMSMTGPARNPHWCTHKIAHVLCGPGEMQLPEVLALSLPPSALLSGVSRECAQLLRMAFPSAYVHTTPGFAHPTVFTYRARTGPVRRAGFVGRSTTQHMQVSGPAKRPEMFSAICATAGVEPVFTEQNYRFEDMQQFYDSVDVVISTSTQEGGPFSPFEAIACGVPALSTDVGIVRDTALPGRFFSITDCVDMIPRAYDFLLDQYHIAQTHAQQSITAWDAFLHAAATVRASTSAG